MVVDGVVGFVKFTGRRGFAEGGSWNRVSRIHGAVLGFVRANFVSIICVCDLVDTGR